LVYYKILGLASNYNIQSQYSISLYLK